MVPGLRSKFYTLVYPTITLTYEEKSYDYPVFVVTKAEDTERLQTFLLAFIRQILLNLVLIKR